MAGSNNKKLLAYALALVIACTFATIVAGLIARLQCRELYAKSVACYEAGQYDEALDGFRSLGRGWIGNRSMDGDNKDVGWYLDHLGESACTCTCDACQAAHGHSTAD